MVDSQGDNFFGSSMSTKFWGVAKFAGPLFGRPARLCAGTSTVSVFNEKMQVDLLFTGDIIALHVVGVSPKYLSLTPARSKNPQEVWDAFSSLRIGVIGPPESVQMSGGGGW